MARMQWPYKRRRRKRQSRRETPRHPEPPRLWFGKRWSIQHGDYLRRLVHILDSDTYVITARCPRDRLYTLCGQRARWPCNDDMQYRWEEDLYICKRCARLEEQTRED